MLKAKEVARWRLILDITAMQISSGDGIMDTDEEK